MMFSGFRITDDTEEDFCLPAIGLIVVSTQLSVVFKTGTVDLRVRQHLGMAFLSVFVLSGVFRTGDKA